jgi:hypothetical protein
MVDFDAVSINYARWPEWNQSEVSDAGETFQWTASNDFGLNVLIPTDVDQIIRFRVLTLTPDSILQSLSLKVNGDPVEFDSNTDEHGGVTFIGVILQSSLAKSVGSTRLAFHTDQVTQTSTLELRGDRRTLGVAFDWLRIEPIPIIPWSVATKFDGYESELLLTSGWHDSETNANNVTFRWTGSTTFTVLAFMPADRDLLIEMRIIQAVAPDILDSLTLEANGAPIELYRQSRGENGDLIRGVLSTAILSKHPPVLRLVFHTNRVVSPWSLGVNDDRREFGLAFANLQIVPVDDSKGNTVPGR